MKIPPYWVRETRELPQGGVMKLHAASDVSMDDARRRLEKRAALRLSFAAGQVSVAELRAGLRALDGHEESEEGYTADICESMVQKVDENNIVTRNRYGAQVLNTTELCFADVDRVSGGFFNTLARLFGGGKGEEAILTERVRALCAADDSLGVRLYRTAAGFRLVLAGQGLALGSPRLQTLFRTLEVDPLYSKLCEKQGCFRARLSPKPSRVGHRGAPRCADSASAVSALADWVPSYEAACQPYAVCRLVEQFGRPISHPALSLHDELTGALLPDRRLA
ncbi:MAG: hypothetical protein MJ051_06125 [Akkermansia sp.]|nr:hypothetical protein [Akkermansia sp.]